jgi:hypothetical protein
MPTVAGSLGEVAAEFARLRLGKQQMSKKEGTCGTAVARRAFQGNASNILHRRSPRAPLYMGPMATLRGYTESNRMSSHDRDVALLVRPLQQLRNRRNFLRFLAASPLLASLPARAWQTHTLDEVLANPKDALDVMDFEAAARKALPPRTGATWLPAWTTT